MKTVLLHGLGQTAQDWKEVVQQLSISDVDCPELFSSTEDEISYLKILGDLEQRYSEVKEPLRICGLSLVRNVRKCTRWEVTGICLTQDFQSL